MNQITTKRIIPAATPLLTQSLSPQEQADHRAKIAFEVEVIMHSYWQSTPPEQVKAGILADWCDALEDWKQEQVVWALRKWRNENPNKRPNPGHVLMLMKEARGKKIAAQLPKQPSEPERERISGDRAAEIMAEAGFNVKKFGQ
tara:strand:+ start:110 stop:541 length:432 start_codon:yes stop_codon:yes gene_type:complete